ncbi:hypothetical protein FF38_00884 [Lucilia cuprina]|uniref:Uncharacterized protein n=1 Tax=Lucilia cuprina TaxID=7375 RepID=A0A0L0BTS2_LUCCU|nr:hypothetical protein FF38_00884 [Lucilia cuprina]
MIDTVSAVYDSPLLIGDDKAIANAMIIHMVTPANSQASASSVSNSAIIKQLGTLESDLDILMKISASERECLFHELDPEICYDIESKPSQGDLLSSPHLNSDI